MEHRNPGRVIYIDGERTGVRIRVAVEEHSLVELAYSEGIPNSARRIGSVVSHGEVIEFVSEPPLVRPYAHTETAILRRTSGVHNLRGIAVPDNYRSIN